MGINWLAQAVGAIGVIAFIVSFQIKSNRALLVIQLFADLMFCIQFVLLGAYSGCLSLAVMLLRNIILMYREKAPWLRWNGWLWVLVGLTAVFTVITWDGLKSLLPLIAGVGSTIMFWRGNARGYRSANLFCACPCWLTYDAIVGSYAGMLNESITLISILVSIFRFGWKALGENSFEKETGGSTENR